EKDPEDARQRQIAARGFAEEALHRQPAVMRDDLREIELRGHGGVLQMVDLAYRIRVRICPSPELQIRVAGPNHFAKLPRVLHASRGTDVLVAAKHDERLEAMVPGTVGISERVFNGVLARQERNDVGSR